MKKFFSIFLTIIFLSTFTSCEKADVFLKTIDNFCGIMNEVSAEQQNFQPKSYTLENNLNESYTIEYTEVIGFPDNSVKVEIYCSGEKIAYYNPCDYKNFDKNKPTSLLFLCENDKNSLYYVGCDTGDYIFICGNNHFNLNYDNIIINKDIVNDKESVHRDIYLELSEMLNHVELSELKEKFEKCGYNYDNIVNLYNLS